MSATRVLFLGGTGPVGTATRRIAQERGYSVIVAHRGQLEPDVGDGAEHVHGERADLLASLDLSADALVDTRATAHDAGRVLDLAHRLGIRRTVVVSSTDVYQAFTDAGPDGPRLPRQTIPIEEDAPLRDRPYPWAPPEHDNAAMERAIRGAARPDDNVAILRPGMIYGVGDAWREWWIVRWIRAGQHELRLPHGTDQYFSRVAVERVGRAVVAAIERAPAGIWPVNVVDPFGWTYAGLCAQIAEQLSWEWIVVEAPFADVRHPFKSRLPYLCSDRRLRDILGVHAPDPRAALRDTIAWLWEHGEARYANDERFR